MNKPKLQVAMPCYDSVKINTMLSLVKLSTQLAKSSVKFNINTLKSPYISYARNMLTAHFMASDDMVYERVCGSKEVVNE